MTKQPELIDAEKRYLAFMGLIQWTQAVIRQAKRIQKAEEILFANPNQETILAIHVEYHYFTIAANKLIEYRQWVRDLGLLKTIDFSEIDRFPVQTVIKDMRDMKEHSLDYLKGKGKFPERWVVKEPGRSYVADASSVFGTLIGGRLDWVKFSAASERLLPALLAEPIPYPPIP